MQLVTEGDASGARVVVDDQRHRQLAGDVVVRAVELVGLQLEAGHEAGARPAFVDTVDAERGEREGAQAGNIVISLSGSRDAVGC